MTFVLEAAAVKEAKPGATKQEQLIPREHGGPAPAGQPSKPAPAGQPSNPAPAGQPSNPAPAGQPSTLVKTDHDVDAQREPVEPFVPEARSTSVCFS